MLRIPFPPFPAVQPDRGLPVLRLVAILTTTALLLSEAGAAPVPKPAPVPLYFPVTVGAKSVFDQDGQEMTVVVKSVENKAGAKFVTTEQSFGKAKLGPGTRYRVSEDGLVELPSASTQLDQPLTFLSSPYQPGHSWKFEVARKPLLQQASGRMTVQAEETVTVPAGTYACVPVVYDGSDGKEMSRVTFWYARDVGLVKLIGTTQENGQPAPTVVTERVLRSFFPKGE